MPFGYDPFCNLYNHYYFPKELGFEGFEILLNTDRSVFHYTSALDSILSHSQLRFSNRHFLMDKTEGWYVFNLLSENIDTIWDPNWKTSKDDFKEECLSWLARTREYSATGFDIFQASLTLDEDSLYMWNYYANSTGYCLKFKLDSLVASFKDQLSDPRGDGKILLYGKVIYNRETQLRMLKKVISDFQQVNTNDATCSKSFLCILFHKISSLGVFFKHPKFEIEHEYRIAFDFFRPDEELKSYAPGMTSRPIDVLRAPAGSDGYRISHFNRAGQDVPYTDVNFTPTSLCSIMCSPYDNDPVIKLTKGDYSAYPKDSITLNFSEIPTRF